MLTQGSSLEIIITKSLIDVTVSKNLLFTKQLNMIGFLRHTVLFGTSEVFIYIFSNEVFLMLHQLTFSKIIIVIGNNHLSN